MTVKQKILKAIYPFVKLFNKNGKKGTILINKNTEPPVSFYSLQAENNIGKQLNFSEFKGKKLLIVNTASSCGFTAQYKELQQLHENFGKKLKIIGFPSNNFNNQENANDAEIAQFCEMNFGVSFTLMKKSIVLNFDGQNQVYEWLTDKNKNGWNAHLPDWNFGKYLVDETGKLTHYFGPAISPLSNEVLKAISKYKQ